jgi:hypothetical protein
MNHASETPTSRLLLRCATVTAAYRETRCHAEPETSATLAGLRY